MWWFLVSLGGIAGVCSLKFFERRHKKRQYWQYLAQLNGLLDRALAGDQVASNAALGMSLEIAKHTKRLNDLESVRQRQDKEFLDEVLGPFIRNWQTSRGSASEFECALRLATGLAIDEKNERLAGQDMDLAALRTQICTAITEERERLWRKAESTADSSALQEYVSCCSRPLSSMPGFIGRYDGEERGLHWAGVRPLEKSKYPEGFDRLVARIWPEAPDEIYVEAITLSRAAGLVAAARSGQPEAAYYLVIRCRGDEELAKCVGVSILAEMNRRAIKAGLLTI